MEKHTTPLFRTRRLIALLTILILPACQPFLNRASESSPATFTPGPQITSTSHPSATPPPPSPPTVLPELQSDLNDLNGIEITFMHPWLDDTSYQVDELVNQFNATNLWGITVNALSTGGESALYDQLVQYLEEDEPPHLVAAPIQTLSSWERDDEIFVDLNLYIQDTDWGLTEAEKADFTRTYWLQDQINDRQIGIPALRTQHVLFYNRSWAHALGFYSDPETLEAFEQQACAAAAERETIDLTGGWIIDDSALTTLSWLYTQGFTGIPENEDETYQFNSARGRAAFNFLWNLSNQGCAWVSRESEPYSYFANRQALFYSGTLKDIIEQAEAFDQAQNDDEWVILPYPGMNMPVVIAEGPSYAVLQTTYEEQLAAWLFLRWMMLPRNQAVLAQAEGALPPSASTSSLMNGFRNEYPQWEAALPLVPLTQPAPHVNSWHIVHMILEDAAWQVYQTNTGEDSIPSILTELDNTILEVLQYH